MEIQPEHFRALACAALFDFKYERMDGGFKDDNLIDGINYAAFLAEEMRVLEKGKPETILVTFHQQDERSAAGFPP